MHHLLRKVNSIAIFKMNKTYIQCSRFGCSTETWNNSKEKKAKTKMPRFIGKINCNSLAKLLVLNNISFVYFYFVYFELNILYSPVILTLLFSSDSLILRDNHD